MGGVAFEELGWQFVSRPNNIHRRIQHIQSPEPICGSLRSIVILGFGVWGLGLRV